MKFISSFSSVVLLATSACELYSNHDFWLLPADKLVPQLPLLPRHLLLLGSQRPTPNAVLPTTPTSPTLPSCSHPKKSPGVTTGAPRGPRMTSPQTSRSTCRCAGARVPTPTARLDLHRALLQVQQISLGLCSYDLANVVLTLAGASRECVLTMG